MPELLTHPGVFVNEVPSRAAAISGVSTSVTAFVGRAARGPVDRPLRITSFGDYQRIFGVYSSALPLSAELTLPSAVAHFFLNGGSEALVVRVAHSAVAAEIELPAGDGSLTLIAENPGSWGNALRATVDHVATVLTDTTRFNLTIEELAAAGSNDVIDAENYVSLSCDSNDANFVTSVLARDSALVRVDGEVPDVRPDATANLAANGDGGDGDAITENQVSGAALEVSRRGIWALENAEMFNLLYLPPFAPMADVTDSALSVAARYCQQRRAVLLVDPKTSWSNAVTAEAGVNALRAVIGSVAARNAAAYFPRLRMSDPLQPAQVADYGPGGAVAGIIARIDAARGVWKSPAGLEASFSGVREFTVKVTDAELGKLNTLGLNSLRTLPVHGHVIWGARTLAGADQLGSEWKYLAVRRTALFIEDSLIGGIKWAMFEANDESLWAQIRSAAEGFLHSLFMQGAFRGARPSEAYFVKCDGETTTQADIDQGVFNIVVGFAPLKPAEFVIVQIEQRAGATRA